MKKVKHIVWLIYLFISRLIPDRLHLQIIFRIFIHKNLNLKTPKTFNEKLQWLKLYNRDPKYQTYVDKYAVRKYIEEKIGGQYLIPLLGVWDRFEDINFNDLPNEFVLKCTHDSGRISICKDKNNLDIRSTEKRVIKCIKKNYFYMFREYPYKNIKPRIICEKYMVDESGYELKDYKFFCFDGVPKALFVATDRDVETHFDFYDLAFQHLPIMQHYENGNKTINKPENFEQMIEIAKILSNGFPHVRVDLYNINGEIYFSELTFFHFSGLAKFEPEKYDGVFGDWLKLPELSTRKRKNI